MNTKIIVNSFRAIKKNFLRFLALLIMSFLACFSYCGLTSAEPDFILSLDTYYDIYNHYDIRIQSNNGLSTKIVDELKKINSINKIMPAYEVDAIANLNNEYYAVNISSLPTNINKIILLEGRLPKTTSEVVVELNLLIDNNLNIGDSITLDDEFLVSNEFTIVGTCNSSLYIVNTELTQDRGDTTIGNGEISYYMYTIEDTFDMNFYTSIYITANNAFDKLTSRKDYVDIINKCKSDIKEIENILINFRKVEIVDELNREISGKEQEGYIELDNLKKQLEDGRKRLDNYKKMLNPSSPNYDSMLKQYNELEYEYSRNVDQYNKLLLDFEEEIKNAYDDASNIGLPILYINDRTSYPVYEEYIEDSQSVGNLAKVFPIIFYIVAVMVSLISMSRMVEDDRMEIGTLKALGFSNLTILSKYMLFSFLATIIGCIIGCVSGSYVLPAMILDIYDILFDVKEKVFEIDDVISTVSIVLTIICVCGSTFFTANKVLQESCAQLMRPKSPKPGKRILFERITFIWKKLSFNQKVTVRNIFRYKKRVFTTIFGILGCTSLMLVGFGLKDSISDIPSMQFGDLFTFDAVISVNEYNQGSEVYNNSLITSLTPTQMKRVKVDTSEVNMIISENSEDIKNIINLVDLETKEIINLEDSKVVITDKLASLYDLSVNDKVEIIDSNGNKYEFEISGIVEMYVEHYIFLNRNTFEMFDKYEVNSLYINTVELSNQNKELFTETLLKDDDILNVSYISDLMEKVERMLESLDKVIIILIDLAAILAFVVLYNLANINIHERKKEIATLKVLGYYNKEVDKYITSEAMIITIIGIILGLVMGYFLTIYVLDTVEIEKARFIHDIKLHSYIYASLLSILFTLIVNYITHFALKKIDMINTLKSVE